MSNYFNNPDDLRLWVQERSNSGDATEAVAKLRESISLLNEDSGVLHEQSLKDCCERIARQPDDKEAQEASEILYGILASNNLVKMQKTSSTKLNKTASDYRPRNKWNRMVEGFKEGTPWRKQRDEMYDFTHYASDLVKFDMNPDHVYSGEAIWRTYIMDKYYREYKNEDGKFVGGYINDRFYVFPDAGTPDNPDAPRDGGNPMGLPNGVRSRKPRESEYSMERRLEEARGNETTSLKSSFASKTNRLVKISSEVPKDIDEDIVYPIFRDSIGMTEDGYEHSDIVMKISEHYKLNPLHVSQVVSFARKSLKKHAGIGYEFKVTAEDIRKISQDIETLEHSDDKKKRFIVKDDIFALGQDNNKVKINRGDTVVLLEGDSFQYQNVIVQILPSDLKKINEVDFQREHQEIIPQDTGIND